MTLELPTYRSYSSYTSFLSCGKQWELSRVFKVPETPAWYLCGGTAVHTATEEWDLTNGTPLTELQSVDLFCQHFQKAVNEQVEKTGIPVTQWRAGGRRSKAWPNKEDAGWWLEHGPPMVRQYTEWWQQMLAAGWQLWQAPGGLPGVELTLMANFGPIPVKMGLDRVVVSPAGQLAVIDLKTGSREPDSNLQLGFYACGMEVTMDQRPSYGAYYMARTAKLTDIVELDTYTVSELTRELGQFNKAVENNIFLPRRGSHCISCGVRRACPAVGGEEAHLYRSDSQEVTA